MVSLNVSLQERITTILSSAVKNGKIANAYLFSGPSGVGKGLVAKQFVKAMNCEIASDDSVCDCLCCKLIEKNSFPDFIEIFPDGARIKVDQIRDLRGLTRFGPSRGARLVVVVNGAETFTLEAANSFLKLLEEPPQNVVFILITNNLSVIIPTIISRCQVFQFSQLSGKSVRSALSLGSALPAASVDEIVDIVQGELVLARMLIDSEHPAWEFIGFLNELGNKNVYDVLKYAEGLAQKEKDSVKDLVNIYCLKLIKLIKDPTLSLDRKVSLRMQMQLCLSTVQNMRHNINIRLHLENMLLQMKLFAKKAS